METKKKIIEFLEERPEILGAFGYGSGVFKQNGYTEKSHPQIDLIILVENMKKWHEKNVILNPKDYSLSGKAVLTKTEIAKKTTGISYQSNITFDGQTFKYGIIEKKDFIHFLSSWDSFYVPGRFHKPVLPIKTDDELNVAIKKNRESAQMVGLLTLEEQKTNIDHLYYNIASLSYMGDIRMLIAENPNKVWNIVNGSKTSFDEIYKQSNPYFTIHGDEIMIDQKELLSSLDLLPSGLFNHLRSIKEEYTEKDLLEIKEQILLYMKKMNQRESIIQPAKGILTNGPIKSCIYIGPKLAKKFKKS